MLTNNILTSIVHKLLNQKSVEWNLSCDIRSDRPWNIQIGWTTHWFYLSVAVKKSKNILHLYTIRFRSLWSYGSFFMLDLLLFLWSNEEEKISLMTCCLPLEQTHKGPNSFELESNIYTARWIFRIYAYASESSKNNIVYPKKISLIVLGDKMIPKWLRMD